jgi:hypothetical protein
MQLDLFDKFTKIPARVKSAVKRVKKDKDENKEISWKIVLIVLKAVFLFCGIGGTIMSFKYSLVWFTMKVPYPFNLIATGMFIVFMVASFEIIALLWKFRYYNFAIIFVFMWLVSAGFSMFCTLGGQYDVLRADNIKMAEKRKSETSVVWEYKRLKESYDTEQKRYDIKAIQAKGFSDSLTELDSRSARMEKGDYEDQRWTIRRDKEKAENELILFEKKLAESKNKLESFIALHPGADFSEQETEDAPDFYLWLQSATGIKPEKMQFWSSVAPAIFYDILSPLSLYVVLFVNGPKRKKEKEDIELTRAEKEVMKDIRTFSFKKIFPLINFSKVPVTRVREGLLEMHIKRFMGLMVKSWFEINEKG